MTATAHGDDQKNVRVAHIVPQAKMKAIEILKTKFM